jgi:uncharacterized protein DUF3373
MKKEHRWKSRYLAFVVGMLFAVTSLTPATLWANDEVQALKQQLQQLTNMMQTLQQKLETLETTNNEKEAEIKEIDQRLNKAELHTATDRISFGVEFRSRADSLHYEDVLTAPDPLMGAFFTPYPMGFNGATADQIRQAIMNMGMAGMIPPPEKNDVDNDIIYTNRFRLNMKAKINSQLSFTGRLAAYKVWGDSSGVKFNQGSMGDFAFDGTTSSTPTDDSIHLERAAFMYRDQVGNVPITASLGRRASTDGPPLEYGNYSLEGGSPLAHMINWQFDGAMLNFGLEDVTNVPGLAFKICYGVGFESGWGNSSSQDNNSQLEDVHMLGVIATLFDNDNTSVAFNYAHAWDITDGFIGKTVMPFIVSVNPNGTYNFAQNTGAFISRSEPATNLGNWDAATLLLRTNLMERLGMDIDLFLSGAWSHTDPEAISQIPFYNLMGIGLLSSGGNLESQDGYSVYAGAVFPMPFNARLGIEYNWGSEYWFNFTGAEDSLIGSKLAVRGQVWEGYYIQPIFEDTFFLKFGGKHYNYEYTGSGNPLGKPVKISEATALDALFPVVDKVWDFYMSATLRF